jgi:hypothetical protein
VGCRGCSIAMFAGRKKQFAVDCVEVGGRE